MIDLLDTDQLPQKLFLVQRKADILQYNKRVWSTYELKHECGYFILVRF